MAAGTFHTPVFVGLLGFSLELEKKGHRLLVVSGVVGTRAAAACGRPLFVWLSF